MQDATRTNVCRAAHLCTSHKTHCTSVHIKHWTHTAHLCTKYQTQETLHTAHCQFCDKKRCNKRTLHIALYVAHCALMCNKMHCGALHTKQTKHCPLHTDLRRQEALHHEHIALYVAHCALMRGKKHCILVSSQYQNRYLDLAVWYYSWIGRRQCYLLHSCTSVPM